MNRFLFGLPAPDASIRDLGLLVGRVVGGLSLALAHGLGKFPPPAGFVDMVAGMGFPAPSLMAWAAAIAELVGGLFLALGLLTKPTALYVVLHFAIVAFYVHRADAFSDREAAVLFLAFGLTILLTGPGRYSLDALLDRDRRGAGSS